MNFQWRISKLCFEFDTEPYYQALDKKVKVSANESFNFCIFSKYFEM